ncbi:MAG TPA: NADH-quinone oxidoreductase subunit NuoK [Patescibacteria group bacterium]|jgi:NADH-quinone oxidoreductase subunit K|nr:NADH-quinone oxidoreductase subunit NuoK [Patescibacteria group bacterium]
MIPTSHILVFSLALFTIGLIGVLTRRNAIIVMMGIELMLNSANINFIAFSQKLGDLAGQVFSIFTIVVAAGEVAVGLAIIISLYRNKDSINVDDMNIMKG